MSYLEELLPEFRKGAKIRMDCWPKGQYICLKDGDIVDEDELCRYDELNRISNWFLNGNWELYQEPIDWDYIIKNKCLCWFYDADESNKRAGILKIISENINVLYWNNYDQQWFNCCPVRRDEVTFYEDKEDE